MSFIGNLTGTSGNETGLDWQAKAGQVQAPISAEQVTAGLKQQQDFINALAGQNGIQNQSDVYNKFGQIASGQGPNPAQAMLAQQTSNNIANQAALMAGQRGSNANAGLIARQAAMQGGNLQQQAVGQGATLQAQQSLNALGQQGGIAGQQVGNQASAIQNYNSNLLGGIGAQNNAAVANASQQNHANAGIQGQIASGQQQMLGNLTNAVGAGLTGIPMGGGGSPVSSQPATWSSGGNDAAWMKYAAPAGLAHGGKVPNYAEGGEIQEPSPGYVVSFLSKKGPIKFAAGGKVPAMVSPGEGYLTPEKAKAVAQGKADAISSAEKIPGKPKVAGAKDSYKNDTVKKTLDEGGVVIPRSKMLADDAHAQSQKFVAAVMGKHGKLPNKKK